MLLSQLYGIIYFLGLLHTNVSFMKRLLNSQLVSKSKRGTKNCIRVSRIRLNEHISEFNQIVDIVASSSNLQSKDTNLVNQFMFNSRLENFNHFIFEFSVMSVLLLLTGATSGIIVNKAKSILVVLEKYRLLYRYQFPFLGSILISLIYASRKDLSSTGPVVLFLNNVFFTKHLLRIIMTIISVGFGSSLAFVGIAAEMGMVIGRFYLELVFVLLENINFAPVEDLMSMKAKMILLICASGAGAGVAANFDAPLTGTFFALEVTRRLDPYRDIRNAAAASSKSTSTTNQIDILKTKLLRTLSSFPLILTVVIASFITVFSTRKEIIWLSSKPHFLSKYNQLYTTFNYKLMPLVPTLIQLFQYGLIGVFGGVVAFFFTSLRDTLAKKFFNKFPEKLKNLQIPILLSGLLCSIMTVYGRDQSLPHAWFKMNQIVSGEVSSLKSIFSTFVERMCTVTFCQASGLPGGVFSPGLLIGSSFGGSLYCALRLLSSQSKLLLSQSTYSLIGGTAVLAGIFQAPLAALFITVELTRNRYLTAPAFIGAFVSAKIANKLTAWRFKTFKS